MNPYPDSLARIRTAREDFMKIFGAGHFLSFR